MATKIEAVIFDATLLKAFHYHISIQLHIISAGQMKKNKQCQNDGVFGEDPGSANNASKILSMLAECLVTQEAGREGGALLMRNQSFVHRMSDARILEDLKFLTER